MTTYEFKFPVGADVMIVQTQRRAAVRSIVHDKNSAGYWVRYEDNDGHISNVYCEEDELSSA